MLQILLALLVIGIVAVIAISMYDNNRFEKENYQFSKTKQTDDGKVKIVFLTDLHNHQYGKHNARLVDAVKEEKPDIILIGGDMFLKNENFDTSISLSLIREMVKIAPVYYSNGNHEKKVMVYWEDCTEQFQEYLQELSKLGVHYLMNESEKLICKGRTFEIIGLDLSLEYYGRLKNTVELSLDELIENNQFPSRTGKDDCRILLAHNPKYFDTYAMADVDYVFSGHVHGGIVILPKLGGVIAPDLSFFPEYDSGTFTKGNTTMVLSRGLGVHSIPIRIFNIPELSVIEL